ncbi:hypothetical protein MCOR02_007966 [Pyricularia oryzae]|uniref:NmrA-like domain-containing protein n=2 Tax=Pyricularia TaxID=48558 RepID=A0ABQ8NPW3_PYRGI|nr:hypothetical protein MCOR01_003998 [Pyricularia oryzae]KAI6300339.1 hypothetical protein MCOR33_003912 [Pyricularia grisea]KAH9430631.1 hypothetical protein MCOR02_007966 [Pyricularia oryzae]KAI6275018.1 hypothetical protein MCOR26_006217 [Pyricularia oryzae]KAI6311784.1 hypothetical protein MCOR34_005881 [Pyricularia oryzae]
MPDTGRNICVTSVDGQTGHLIAELILTHETFSFKADSVIGLSLDAKSEKAAELESLGAVIVEHKPGSGADDLAATLKKAKCDTICLVPPARSDKLAVCTELVEAARAAGVSNALLISSAGADYAERETQPRLREFIDIEALVLANKGDPDNALAHSPCVIRAGFYAENLLVYAPQASTEGVLPIPIGENHKFAPVALGDVAQVAAHVLTGKGPHGFDDRHRGQMMVMTGPMLASGKELATSASKGVGSQLQFQDIPELEAKVVLRNQSESDESELEYILEYYSLVREGKTNYIATSAFHYVTGGRPTELDTIFEMYAGELRPQKKRRTATESN